MRLDGKVTLITGADSGIGLATARRFAAEGATVLAVDRDRPVLDMAFPPEGGPGRVHLCTADVTVEADVVAAFDRLAELAGPPDVVYANAGIAGDGTALKTSRQEFERVLATNLTGVFLTAREAVRRMQGRGGSLIMQGSITGMVAFGDEVAYEASKGGVHALTRALAIDHASEGIRVNAICPGVVITPMVERWFAEAGPQLAAEVTARHPLGLGSPRTWLPWPSTWLRTSRAG